MWVEVVVRLFIAAVLLAASSLAAAFAPQTQYFVQSSFVSSWYSAYGSKESACAEYGAIAGAQQGGYPGQTVGKVSASGTFCEVWKNYGDMAQLGGFGSAIQSVGACPANSTGTSDCTCKSGFIEEGGSCVVKKSELDQWCARQNASKFTEKMTGKTGGSMPEQSCYAVDPPFEGEETRGCLMNTGDGVVVPNADGTRQWSTVAKYTGGTCALAPDLVLGEPRPGKKDTCAGGFLGTVNGVEKCVPAEPDKGIAGIKTQSSVGADGTRTDVKESTQCDGAQCTTTKTTTQTPPNGGVPTTTTSSTTMSITDKCLGDRNNPVCTKTGTTRGTDQTSSGTGQSTGGGGGGGSDGKAVCGAAPLPPCAVKVDETGVKDKATDQFDAAKGEVDAEKEKMNQLREKVAGDGDKGFFSSFSGLWSAPPIQQCEPFQLPQQIAKTIDPCNVVDGVRGIMAWIWALSALYLCFRWIKEVI